MGIFALSGKSFKGFNCNIKDLRLGCLQPSCLMDRILNRLPALLMAPILFYSSFGRNVWRCMKVHQAAWRDDSMDRQAYVRCDKRPDARWSGAFHQRYSNMMRAIHLSGWSALLAGAAILLALIAFAALAISGMVWVSQHLVWYAQAVALVAFWLCALIFLPMSAFARTRRAAFYGFVLAAIVFGVCTWMLGLLSTYQSWGGLGVLIGLVLAFIGLVPLGMLAALFAGQWMLLAQLIAGVVLTWAARTMAMWLSAWMVRAEMDRHARVIEGEILARHD